MLRETLRAVSGLMLALAFVVVIPAGMLAGEPTPESPAATVGPPAVTAPPAAALAAPVPIPVRPPVAPPPGTLGQTYRRPSRLVPLDRHPRTAMIDVAAPLDATTVSVEGLEELEGFRDGQGVWHFESKRPLMPGIPHIYVVAARAVHNGQPVTELRSVRLIPGRIVFLEF